MKKSDLRTGMKVVLEDGSEYIVMLDMLAYGKNGRNLLIPLDSEIRGYINLNTYYEDMTKDGHHGYDISEVYVATKPIGIFDKSTTWKKIYPEKKKMTIEEIEKELGYEIEIVD